ncbi:MAG: hypothetical protein IKA51_02070 [Clostridia bacterium]|nr:hypothetical protein [Clostridia bacterium]
MKLKAVRILLPLLLFTAMSLTVLFGGSVQNAAYNAIISLVKVFVPSIFPFLVLSNLAINGGFLSPISRRFGKLMRIFSLPPYAAEALLLGAVSGFPVGATSAASLYLFGKISKDDAEQLISFCNFPGPAFVISGVGVGIFGSVKTGAILYFSVIIAGLLTGFIMRFLKKDSLPLNCTRSFNAKQSGISLFTNSVKNAASSMAVISAFIVFFAVIISIIENIGLFSLIPSRFLPLLSGFFELTYGLRHISDASPFSLASAAAILSFSGLCVFMQTASAILDSRLDMKKYLIGKIISAVLAFIITYSIFYFLMPLDF